MFNATAPFQIKYHYKYMSSKQEIIGKIYYDKSGFGSKATTLRDAREKDKTIKMEDVEAFFRKNVEQKKQLRGYNSYVAPNKDHEYQMDLFFLGDLKNQKFRVGLIMIDVFTKYMVIIPIPSKNEGDVASGMIEALKKMKGKPKILYTDDEKSFSTDAMQKYLKDEGISHHITRGHANFSERAIRTFKDMLYKRIEADERKGKDNLQWHDYILQIVLTYNNKMKHSATGKTPVEASKKENELSVRMKIASQANKTRKYPPLSVGSQVKIYRKKGITEKERSSSWQPQIYTVENITTKFGQEYYRTSQGSREYLRFELLKV